MTNTCSTNDCKVSCSPKGSSDPSCGCADAAKPNKPKATKYVAGFMALCVIGCAVPPLLVGLGFVGLASGAYLGAGLEMALLVLAVTGLGFVLMRYLKKKC